MGGQVAAPQKEPTTTRDEDLKRTRFDHLLDHKVQVDRRGYRVSSATVRKASSFLFGQRMLVRASCMSDEGTHSTIMPDLSGILNQPIPSPNKGLLDREFDFWRDTLGFRNETEWVYGKDPKTGKQTHESAHPKPTYSLRCFVMARTVQQFHLHSEFQPNQARLSAIEYRSRVQEVVRQDPRKRRPHDRRIQFPGYAGLRELSDSLPEVIKSVAGGAWQSYAQRGNWRMVLPFLRSSQIKESQRIAESVAQRGTAVVHVADFPRLQINHALLAYSSRATPSGIAIATYDPNAPATPLELTFSLTDSRFRLPSTAYYIGGWVNAYEVYCSFLR